MQELIKVTEVNGQKVVSARTLHAFLGCKKQFADWIKNRIQKYGFVEGQDYAIASPIGEAKRGGHNAVDYALTLDTAKELAMLENNAKGREARQYFIECEKQSRGLVLPQSQSELILMIAQQNHAQEQQLQELRQRTLMLEAKANTSAHNFFTVTGYAHLKGRRVPLKEAAEIGKKAKALSIKLGLPIESVSDIRYGKVNAYAAEVLEQVFNNPLSIAV